jgi:hypothetical protein
MFSEDERLIAVGGVTTTVAVVRQAAATLQAAPSVMVAQSLRQAANPLTVRDYHEISTSVLRAHPEMDWPSGTHSQPSAHVKPRVIHYLELTCPACWPAD